MTGASRACVLMIRVVCVTCAATQGRPHSKRGVEAARGRGARQGIVSAVAVEHAALVARLIDPAFCFVCVRACGWVGAGSRRTPTSSAASRGPSEPDQRHTTYTLPWMVSHSVLSGRRALQSENEAKRCACSPPPRRSLPVLVVYEGRCACLLCGQSQASRTGRDSQAQREAGEEEAAATVSRCRVHTVLAIFTHSMHVMH